jgi:uncharacterized protein YodC (DUF2158 family)
MSDTFKVGDRVRLKSGGPAMTVEDVGTDMANRPRVWCVWFDDKKVHKQQDFAPETLELDR